MKIMKVLDKKIGDITYYKYRINLPKEIVESSKLLDKELEVKKENNKIVLEIVNNRKDSIVKNKEIKQELTKEQEIMRREFLKIIKQT